MPKRTLQQVLSQIDALQREAEQLRSAEVKDVITRIQEAIGHYGLTAKDLFPKAKKADVVEAPGGAAVKKRKRKSAVAKRPAGVPKFIDPAGSGKTWTGQGKRPGWFVAAVEAGKQPDELLIK